jgi:uncharacterized membrane protein YfhO
VEIEVEATEPALVVHAQSYCHNWRAWAGKERVPLVQANHAFQAVQVPAGRHEITFVYEDRAFYCGAIVSVMAVAMWVVLWRRERRRFQPAPP